MKRTATNAFRRRKRRRQFTAIAVATLATAGPGPVVVRFEKGRPGKLLMHCHILDPAQGGLMGTIQVGTPPPDHPTTTEHMQH